MMTLDFTLSPALEREFAKNRVYAVFLDILEDIKHILGREAKDCTLPEGAAHTFWNHIADISVDIPYLFPNRRIWQLTRFVFLALAFWFVIGQSLAKGIANINAGQPLVPNIGPINLPGFLATSTATLTSTLTPSVTPTMTPSPTPEPTFTPTVTFTPTPTPLPMPIGLKKMNKENPYWCTTATYSLEAYISEEEFFKMVSSLQLEGEWRYFGSGGLLIREEDFQAGNLQTGTFLEGCFYLYPWPAPETGDFYLESILGYRIVRDRIIPVLFSRYWYQGLTKYQIPHKILVQP